MYGGSVISCSTRERAQCLLDSSGSTPGITLEVSGERQVLTEVADLVLRGDHLDIARAVISALDVDPATVKPFSLDVSTTIPMRAGLAGSTAIIATVVGALLTHLGLRLNPYETAELVRKIEYDHMHCICGFQDAYMTVFGGINYMDFRDKFSFGSQDPSSPFATTEVLNDYVDGLPLILAHTGVKHHSGTVHKSIRERWMEGEKAVVDGYTRVAQLARLAKKAVLASQWDTVASLMNANHAIVRDLGGSGESNEELIAAALNGGAIGAKLAGAGGGGTIVALTFNPDQTIAALEAAGADSILHPAPNPGLTVEILV
jgi:galactokinase/mevalonate kinase-like predicted kinase